MLMIHLLLVDDIDVRLRVLKKIETYFNIEIALENVEFHTINFCLIDSN